MNHPDEGHERHLDDKAKADERAPRGPQGQRREEDKATETPQCSTVGCEKKPYQRFQAKVADEDGDEEWISYSTCRAHRGEVLQELFAHISRRINLTDRVVRTVDYDPIARESI